MAISNKEKDVLRRLASRYMEYANLPTQKEKIELWRSLNRGEMERPMVCMDQLPFEEIISEEISCIINDPFWRSVEQELRYSIYKWENFTVDMVLQPFVAIPKVITHPNYGVLAVREYRETNVSNTKSQHYTPVITCFNDVSKIKDNHISYDKSLSLQQFEVAKEIFGDIAPVVQKGIGDGGFYLGFWDYLSERIGIEESYIALYEDPDFVHAAMQRMIDATVVCIEEANQMKLFDDLSNLCHCSYIYTDELLPSQSIGKGSVSQNCWAFGLAQIFTGVSPDMFKEFEFDYLEKVAPYFGMIYYGCCDKMDNKLDIIKRLPNLKKVSCSPWSNKKNFAENIGTEIVMSYKPNPAFLATASIDEEQIRSDILSTCELAKANNVNLEFILKDVSTVCGDPTRLSRWADIVMDVVCNKF